MTSPWTWNDAAPLERLTIALPPRVDQANVPLSILSETGLVTPCAVITPTMPRQRTTFELLWAMALEARPRASAPAIRIFIAESPSEKARSPWPGRERGGRYRRDSV